MAPFMMFTSISSPVLPTGAPTDPLGRPLSSVLAMLTRSQGLMTPQGPQEEQPQGQQAHLNPVESLVQVNAPHDGLSALPPNSSQPPSPVFLTAIASPTRSAAMTGVTVDVSARLNSSAKLAHGTYFQKMKRRAFIVL